MEIGGVLSAIPDLLAGSVQPESEQERESIVAETMSSLVDLVSSPEGTSASTDMVGKAVAAIYADSESEPAQPAGNIAPSVPTIQLDTSATSVSDTAVSDLTPDNLSSVIVDSGNSAVSSDKASPGPTIAPSGLSAAIPSSTTTITSVGTISASGVGVTSHTESIEKRVYGNGGKGIPIASKNIKACESKESDDSDSEAESEAGSDTGSSSDSESEDDGSITIPADDPLKLKLMDRIRQVCGLVGERFGDAVLRVVKEVADLRSEKEEFLKEIEELRGEISGLKSEVRRSHSDQVKVLDRAKLAELSVKSLNSENAKLKEENERLTKQLNHQVTEHEVQLASATDALKEQLADSEQKLALAVSEFSSYRARLSAAVQYPLKRSHEEQVSVSAEGGDEVSRKKRKTTETDVMPSTPSTSSSSATASPPELVIVEKAEKPIKKSEKKKKETSNKAWYNRCMYPGCEFIEVSHNIHKDHTPRFHSKIVDGQKVAMETKREKVHLTADEYQAQRDKWEKWVKESKEQGPKKKKKSVEYLEDADVFGEDVPE